ncbi:MAG: response regulator [Planctomycetes bacterium]|nr:response regulator [Planctomycetota bacterium]
MSVVTVFSGTYCRGDEITGGVVEALGCELLDDAYVIHEASKRFGIAENKLMRTLAGGLSIFNRFTHERERHASCLKLVVAETMKRDRIVLSGFCGQLVPADLSHVLSVCIIADIGYRCDLAMQTLGVSEKEARRTIQESDEMSTRWTDFVLGKSPWDSDIYDVFIPTNRVEVDEAVKLVCRNAHSGALVPTEDSLRAVDDFILAAQVEVMLGTRGHDVAVSARGGNVTLVINKHTVLLSRLEGELKRIAQDVEGVKDVETKVGPGFYQPGVYRQFNPELPSKVLLVDDEKEFVETLSERLEMRDMGSTVVYSGEQALSLVREEEPEVMVLDLRMPGVNGIEVLREIKQTHRHVEVIVLTGHGSKKDEETCMKLGAFAYLQKPVDIEKLSRTMREAYEEVKAKQKKPRVNRAKEGE